MKLKNFHFHSIYDNNKWWFVRVMQCSSQLYIFWLWWTENAKWNTSIAVVYHCNDWSRQWTFCLFFFVLSESSFLCVIKCRKKRTYNDFCCEFDEKEHISWSLERWFTFSFIVFLLQLNETKSHLRFIGWGTSYNWHQISHKLSVGLFISEINWVD